jgi:mannosyl-3-phosphoglycerate phosphatase
VFTDLDGTLLEDVTYDWTPAAGALAELERRDVPLVLASSKTRAEIEIWRRRLGNAHPFICENGGALFVPLGGSPEPPHGSRPVDGYARVRFGTDYATLRAALRELSAEIGVRLIGFADWSDDEIGRRTGLPAELRPAARAREFDEPFLAERSLTPREQDALERSASNRGLTVVRGGRFWHLTGANDKGRAARTLLMAYRAGGRPPRSLALGDAGNDRELLSSADRAAIVARPDGTHDPELAAALPDALRTRGIGPHGFAEGVGAFLSELDGR